MFGSSQGLNVRSHVCRDFSRVSFTAATLSLALFASAARGEDDAQVKGSRAFEQLAFELWIGAPELAIAMPVPIPIPLGLFVIVVRFLHLRSGVLLS